MVSDIEIPILDLDQPDPFGDYDWALEQIEVFASRAEQFVPGHGRPGNAAELRRRLERDRTYLHAVRKGRPVTDDRLTQRWLQEQHEQQMAWLAERR